MNSIKYVCTACKKKSYLDEFIKDHIWSDEDDSWRLELVCPSCSHIFIAYKIGV